MIKLDYDLIRLSIVVPVQNELHTAEYLDDISNPQTEQHFGLVYD